MKFVLGQPETGLIIYDNVLKTPDLNLIGKVHGFKNTSSWSDALSLLALGTPTLFALDRKSSLQSLDIIRQVAIRHSCITVFSERPYQEHCVNLPSGWALIVHLSRADFGVLEHKFDLMNNVGPVLDISEPKNSDDRQGEEEEVA